LAGFFLPLSALPFFWAFTSSSSTLSSSSSSLSLASDSDLAGFGFLAGFAFVDLLLAAAALPPLASVLAFFFGF